jgi:acetyl esterase/lipase
VHMSLRVVALIGMLSLAVVAPSFAARGRNQPRLVLPPNVEMKRDVVYGKGGERELKCDLFLPKGTSTAGGKMAARPGIVFIHGGGWSGGTRGQFHKQAAYLAGKGYVGACIEYRLSREAKFPAALEDCKCAVRWMRANAKTYHIDPDRIAVCGGSAGGHLASMVGLTKPSDGFEGKGGHQEFSSRVQLVVDFNGVSDLDELAKGRPLYNSIQKFLGPTYKENPKLYVIASPISHVDAKAPPFLLLHGTDDTTVPFEQSVAMMKKLQAAGVEAELFEAKGAKHGFFNRPPFYEPTLKRMEAFLDKHFRANEEKK